MEDKVHIFYVGSYFHVVLSHSIIRYKQININNVYFLTYRGLKLPDYYKDRLLIDSPDIYTFNYSKTRKELLGEYNLKLKKIFRGHIVCAYFPFQYSFPLYEYYDEYYFFEEGFSSYRETHESEGGLKALVIQFLSDMKRCFLYPLVDKRVKGVLFGCWNLSPIPIQSYIYRISDNAYRNLKIRGCKTQTIPICREVFSKSNISNSLIVVFDRISAAGRPYDIKKYMEVVEPIVSTLAIKYNNVYIKLHPADFNNLKAMDVINGYFKDIKYQVISESLEGIALSDNSNTFLGSNSTILYYASILGSTNESISFVRLLAEHDAKYKEFLSMWGGLNRFITMINTNVTVI